MTRLSLLALIAVVLSLPQNAVFRIRSAAQSLRPSGLVASTVLVAFALQLRSLGSKHLVHSDEEEKPKSAHICHPFFELSSLVTWLTCAQSER